MPTQCLLKIRDYGVPMVWSYWDRLCQSNKGGGSYSDVALVAVTVGLLASRTLRSPFQTLFLHLFFNDTLHMKIWLITAALLLGLSRLLTATHIYGLLHFPPSGRFYNVVHRWSWRTDIVLTLPVAYHCIFLLGFGTYDTRVYIRTLLGSSVYGAFLAKVFIVWSKGFPGWALPIARGVMLSILLGVT